MKHLSTFVGACIAGMFVFSVWGAFDGAYGIAGGWFAGFIIISSMWFLNHYIGIIDNIGNSAVVDMALGIGTCAYMRDTFLHGGSAASSSAKTLITVIIGGILGGLCGGAVQKYVAKRDESQA
ncbi:MAG: hypothetical protein N4A63_14280 [Vallitalea sp.]|jgi:hypothetical protein|nr:hypothetical protein [Vallitalea sp.]